ncbi:MAG TPA: hypothetical protein PKG60_12990 [Spirochaetota bacterium]|mgnify:CR=1 FL=1|nr:hypothetical protein [Spirochaetota bacterium]
MKFQFLLFILGRKLKGKVKNDPDFKKKVAEKNCTVQIKTADNSKGRYYIFNDGEVDSKKGIAANPTVALVWKDAATGFAVLSSGDAAKNMEAIQNGSLKFEGEGAAALWFAGIAKGAR